MPAVRSPHSFEYNLNVFPASNTLHKPISPVLSCPFTATSEGDTIYYFAHAVILPCLSVLDKFFPGLELKVEREKEDKAKIPSEDKNEDSKAFLDFHFSARFKMPPEETQNPWEPVIIYEAKKPGGIWPKDWDAERNQGKLIRNAEKIAQQGRKYLTAFKIGTVVYGDGVRLPSSRSVVCTTTQHRIFRTMLRNSLS
jgi:hypothetical protein